MKKVHKRLMGTIKYHITDPRWWFNYPLCGQLYDNPEMAYYWKDITCKLCLKKGGK